MYAKIYNTEVLVKKATAMGFSKNSNNGKWE